MADPQPGPSVEEFLEYAAVALFVERSQAARPGFALTESNAAAVAGICAQLDGPPLAIELAAVRSKLFSPEAMLARLGSRLAFLAAEGRSRVHGLAKRSQTLRGTIDWSYGLLDAEEQRLFARLGVFAGGFTVEAVESVARDEGGGAKDDFEAASTQASSLEDILVSLLDDSMLRHETDAAGEPRFWMLLTLREYALERLSESGELEAVRERHARHYLALAEQIAPDLTGPRQVGRLRQLSSERDNLRAAPDWAGTPFVRTEDGKFGQAHPAVASESSPVAPFVRKSLTLTLKISHWF